MTHSPGSSHVPFVDTRVGGDVEELVDDQTIGLLTTYDEAFLPESWLVDPERLERALIAVREYFEAPDSINLAVVEAPESGTRLLALYPDDDRSRAVVLAPRMRPNDTDFDPVVEEVETA